MSEKTVILPDHEEMFRRLLGVSDDAYMQERFYPILLKKAGRQLVAPGVVMLLTLAIHDFVDGMPPGMANAMFAQAPDFIDALVTDAEVAEQAKTFLREALSAKK